MDSLPRSDPNPTDPFRLLDGLPDGLLCLDADGRIDWANAAARDALAQGAFGLTLRGRVLRPADPGLLPEWLDALEAAAAGTPVLAVLELRPRRSAAALAPWSEAPGPATVLCTLPPCPQRATASVRAYGRLHRLTEAETDVVHALAAGAVLKDIARRRGTSEMTVRSQLKTILTKTALHSARELVVDVLRGPRVAGSPPTGLSG
ncbi:MAG: PAS domain-containing protein [Burkholderiaceae bacterium]|jgi:DNA-binding NarL/FixJ family response regulator|nr:PAS domain-containing protein [Burkholderiales bacterium]MCZ8340590.1 PAS domain-containing protein [Burkholderiaceae bacterium]